MGKKQDETYEWVLSEIVREVQIYPQYADLENHFALLLMAGGDMEKAESHFLEALRLNPKYREAILNLGFLYIEMRRWKEAEDIFLSEVKRHPKDGLLHHVLGILSLQVGKKKGSHCSNSSSDPTPLHLSRLLSKERDLAEREGGSRSEGRKGFEKDSSGSPRCTISQLYRSLSC